MNNEMKLVTCTAPVNIAVIKYWGKRDESLILPINDSISATLSSDQMHAKTTVAASPQFIRDRIWLNGKEESFENIRLTNCLREVRKRAAEDSKNPERNPNLLNWKIHICSENNFPTAAGLASSAAGYACLVSALCQLYGVKGDISQIARQGSGSACRSVFGGFVQWESGTNLNGSDSIAKQLFPADHWSEMRILILVANDGRKKVSSSVGMKLSVQTSELLKHRAETIVPERIKEMTEAIRAKNFSKFAELTMRDSNQLHSVCLDTYPPCTYMNQTSHAVLQLVHEFNSHYKENKICYTFDAGPNACLFMMEREVAIFSKLILKYFPPSSSSDTPKETDFFRGEKIPATELSENILSNEIVPMPDALKYVIHTRVGRGPEILQGQDQHLLSLNGEPKKLI